MSSQQSQLSRSSSGSRPISANSSNALNCNNNVGATTSAQIAVNNSNNVDNKNTKDVRGGGRSGKSSAWGNHHPRKQQQQPRHNHNRRGQGQFRGQPQRGEMTSEADEPYEVGSVFNHGSKKSNLNHLLNFTYEPRGTQKNGRRNQQQHHQHHARPAKKHNKEQFLHANCDFVVKSNCDYTPYLTDPDLIVDWENIEQIQLKSTAAQSTCPICLYEPEVAPRIAGCGHVFCWPCLLHYFALTDEDYRCCPICYHKIDKQNGVKSLVAKVRPEFKVNDHIEMRLMRRERNSLFAVPVGKYRPEIESKHPNIHNSNNFYSKLIIATPQDVANKILAREKAELEAQLQRDKDEAEAVFIHQALNLLEERLMTVLTEKKDVSEMATLEEDCVEEEDLVEDDVVGAVANRPRHESSSSSDCSTNIAEFEEDVEDEEDNFAVEDLDICKQQQAKSTFYFYQSSDGQNIFLHALNVQMLMKEHGGELRNCPQVIRGKILEKDNANMSEELRDKLRYLRHLPVSSGFEVAQLDLHLSKETMAEFADQLEARKRRRLRSAREEKRRDKRIQMQNDKSMLGIYPDPKLRIESSFHFPQVGESGEEIRRSTESLHSSEAALSVSPHNQEQPSFSRMLREGAARPSNFINRNISNNISIIDEDLPEGYVPPPPQASIGDALALALEQAAINKGQNGSNSGGKKNKKGKRVKGTKIVLGF